jgi:phosphosulfolactate synthase (CoM biosynthesis protein A)
MKRLGFVSNSSSASFVINLDKLTKEEYVKLINYLDGPENMDGWGYEINKKKGVIEGYTSMDNFAFHDFCEKIGLNKVIFENWS